MKRERKVNCEQMYLHITKSTRHIETWNCNVNPIWFAEESKKYSRIVIAANIYHGYIYVNIQIWYFSSSSSLQVNLVMESHIHWISHGLCMWSREKETRISPQPPYFTHDNVSNPSSIKSELPKHYILKKKL